MGKQGRASVDVVGDVSRFAAQLERDLNRELRGVDVDVGPVSRQISTGIDKAADEAGDALRSQIGAGAREAGVALGRMGEEAEDAADQIGREMGTVDAQIERVQRSVRELAREFARTGDADIFVKLRGARTAVANLRLVRAALDEVGDEAKRTERRMDDVAGGVAAGSTLISRSLGNVFTAITGVGSALVGLGASAPTPAGILAIGAALLGLAAAIPVLIGVGAALADLVGLVGVLPAGIATLLAVVAPLKVAFLGFGEAVSAVVDGDPDKIKEAMLGLAPAARSVVGEIQRLLPRLRDLKTAVQQRFFAPLQGTLTTIAGSLLPTVRKGMGAVAAAAGGFAARIGAFLKTPQVRAFLDDLFATAARIVRDLAPGAERLLAALIGVAKAGLPFIERFAKVFTAGLTRFATFISGSLDSGAFERFVGDALKTFGELWDLTKGLTRLLKSLFADADDEGRTFLATLTEVVNQMAEFFESSEGKAFLQSLIDLLPVVGALLASLVIGLQFVANAVNATVFAGERIGAFFQAIPGWLDAAGAAMTGWASTAWNAVVGFFVGVGGFFANLGTTIASWGVAAWNAVAGFFTRLGAFLAGLPGLIGGWLIAAGTALVGGLKATFDLGLRAVGVGIGLILFNFTVLPGMIWRALQALPPLLASLFTSAWNAARNITVAYINALVAYAFALPGRIWSAIVRLGALIGQVFVSAWTAARNITVNQLNAVVAFAFGLPGRIGGALARLPGIIGGAFRAALAAGRAAVVSGFNAIVAFAGSAAGRLAGLAGRFLSAGRNIISGFFSGLRSAGGFAGDVGGAIVRALRSGLNSVIGSINSGISAIDSVLPGSLPRIPGVARGGLTTGELLAQLHPQELVLPLEDRRATDLLGRALAQAAEHRRGGDGATLAGGDVNVRVFLGTRELTDIVRIEIDEHDRGLARRVTAGTGG